MLAHWLKNIRKTDFLRNIITVLSGSTIAQVIPLVISPVLTRLYNPSDFGVLALYMSILSLLSVVVNGRYELAIMLPKQREDALNITAISLSITLIISTLSLFVFIGFNRFIAQSLNNETLATWLPFLPLSVLLIGIYQTFTYYANRSKYFTFIALGSFNQSLVTTGGKLSGGFTKCGAGGLIIATIAGQVVATTVLCFQIIKKEWQKHALSAVISRQKMLAVAKKYSVYPKFNMLHAFTDNFSGSMPFFILSAYFTDASVGFYSLTMTMAFRPLNLLSNSVLQVFSQKIIEKFNHNEKIHHDVVSLIKNLIKIAIVPTIIVALFSQTLFGFVFGDEWSESGLYLQLLLPWLFMLFLTAPLSFLPELFFKQKKAMTISLIYFSGRFLALLSGVYFQSIFWAVLLFGLVSFVMVSYTLFWYLSLTRKSDSEVQ